MVEVVHFVVLVTIELPEGALDVVKGISEVSSSDS